MSCYENMQNRRLCTSTRTSRLVESLTNRFIQECRLLDLEITPELSSFLIKLFVRDRNEGLLVSEPRPGKRNARPLDDCTCERFIERILRRFENQCDPTICSIRLTHYLITSFNENDATRNILGLKMVRAKYTADFQNKLKELIDNILQYPETSNRKQLDEMFIKMQVFIVANYNLGCPKNHVLRKRVSQGLNSVIGRGDLQNYVLKKRYHRLEYLQRLGATVCGILVHNNHGPNGGEKEHMRDVLTDLEMAQINTKNSLENTNKRMTLLRHEAQELLEMIYNIDTDKEKALFYCPIENVNEIGQFITLFAIYERQLRRLLATFDRTAYLVSVARNKMICVVAKINEVLKFRTAVESELIFPHFVYLSELWTDLVLYLNFFAELNRVKDHMDALITAEIVNKFQELLIAVRERYTDRKAANNPIVESFEELIRRNYDFKIKDELGNEIPDSNMKEYCTLGFVLMQGGAFLPANLQKKLYQNINVTFGFHNMENAKCAEKMLHKFKCLVPLALWTNIDAILHFNLAEKWIKHDFFHPVNYKAKWEEDDPLIRNSETQTEMVVVNNLTPSNHINVTWNAWDFHRETIRMANVRRCQTHSAQTILTFGRRDAQQQSYKSRRHY